MPDKPLPSSDEAERVILGAILLDNSVIAQVVETLTPEDFYSPLHKRVFGAMVSLFDRAVSIDPILIGEELKKEGALDAIGGVSTITNLTFGLPHFTNVTEYISTVKDKALSRQLLRTSSSFVDRAMSEATPGTELLEEFQSELFALQGPGEDLGLRPIFGLVEDSVQQSRFMAESGQRVIGLPTTFLDYDDRTLGLHNSELTILAARPSMGKTALALNIAQNVAIRGLGVVAFFSLEMGASQLADRIITSEANINSHSFRTGRLSPEQWTRVEEVRESLRECRLVIDDKPSVTVSYMRAKLRRLFHTYRQLDLVIVDYLQLMTGKGDSREREVAKLSRDLKGLAKEFDVPVIATAQLNRAVEDRSGHIPTMRDLRESGAIEQDADVVSFIYRPDYYVKDSREWTHTADVIIGKQRNGPTGTIQLQFDAPSATFRNLAPPQF